MSATLELVKQLRTETDAPYQDCVSALKEASDDIVLAREILKERGKVTTRTAVPNEGRILIVEEGERLALVGIKCETDFAANTEIVRNELALMADNLLNGNSPAYDESLPRLRSALRENVEVLAGYIHDSSASPGIKHAHYLYHDGKRAAIVFYTGDDAEAARKVAIQVVATSPQAVSREHMDQTQLKEMLDQEIEAVLDMGKPAAIAAKVAEGRLASKLKEFVLTEMPMYDNKNQTVGAFVKSKGIDIQSIMHISV